MISTTTNAIEGKRIVEYKGIVFGEVISGVNFVRDLPPDSPIFSAGVPIPMKMSCNRRAMRRCMRWSSAPPNAAQMR